MSPETKKARRTVLATLLFLALAMTPALAVAPDAPHFKPGWNLYSPEKDIEVGKASVAEVEKQIPLLKDPQIDNYVSNLGHKLVRYAPDTTNTDYPWTFKVVNSSDINAFALPGGFIYVNRGVLEAAENEAEVAGVMAHETGHVVMRHGTHQASQAVIAQLPLAVLGGVLGQSSSITAQLAEAGIGLGVNSLMLKNSRSAESQADQVGTYILYQSGYDPHAMARFFEIIQQKYPQRTLQFFSDHPNPENRIKAVDAEIPTLGQAKQWQTDSPEFEAVKKRVASLPPAPKAKPAAQAGSQPSGPPPAPSGKLVSYRGANYTISYPDNWNVQESQDSVVIAPQGGVFADSNGAAAQAYGASITAFRSDQGQSRIEDATSALIRSWQQSNPAMRIVNQNKIRVRGHNALSTMLENDSPISGQKETDQLVTVQGKDAIVAVTFIAPQRDYSSYQSTFQAMLKSFDVR